MNLNYVLPLLKLLTLPLCGLCVGVCVCVWVCLCVCVCVGVYVCMKFAAADVRPDAPLCSRFSVCVCVCVHAWDCVSVSVSVYCML